MELPTAVEISVVGSINDQVFGLKGRLAVDWDAGRKSGPLTFGPVPARFLTGLRGSFASYGCFLPPLRCSVGAKAKNPKGFVEPLRLLGARFLSERTTQFGSQGFVAQSESARLRGSTLYSDQIVLGRLKTGRIQSAGPIREVIEVSADNTLTGRGRYVLRRARGPPVRVTYTHFYRSLEPNARLFRARLGKQYHVRVVYSSELRGRVVEYRATSTIDAG